jgi:multidrug efflux pump subunit AcrA (membrane-fusion protein)
MENTGRDSQPVEASEVFQVTPVESPSKNYLVIENLQRMPNIFSRGVIYIVMLSIVSTLLYSFFSEVDIVVECRAVTRPTSHEIRVFTNRNGYIEKIFISEGQTVEKNAPLFTIRSKESLTYFSESEELRHSIPDNEEFPSGKKNGKEDDEDEVVKVVRTGGAGTISKLYFRDTGEYVRKSDLLCIILPTNGPLYVDITVANKDIGFIERDMEIKYKFDAFPYTDCGVLLGKVSTISPSAVEDRTLGLVYHLQGALDKTFFYIREKKYPLKAGMTATAEIVTEKKSIFSILFKKLKG